VLSKGLSLPYGNIVVFPLWEHITCKLFGMVGFVMLKGLLDVVLDIFVGIFSAFQELFAIPAKVLRNRRNSRWWKFFSKDKS
jgi:hypothetical protein